MNMLLAGLGLGQVSGDPNDFPVGRYDGIVSKSEYSIKDDGTINHVVTIRVDGGQYDGKSKARWFKLGENPLNAQGQPTKNPAEVAQFHNTMTEDNRSWYKKLWLDLGVPQHLVDSGQATPDMLEGKPCVFGIAERQGYKNVNFIDKRDVVPVAPLGMMQPQQGMGMPFGNVPQPQVQQPFQQGQVVQQPQQPAQTAPQQQNPYQNQPQQQVTNQVPTQNPWEAQPQQAQAGNPWQDLTSPETLAQQNAQGAAPANQQPNQEQPAVVFGGGPVQNEQQIAPGVPPVQ